MTNIIRFFPPDAEPSSLEPYFSNYPVAEDCKNQEIIADLTPGNVEELAINIRDFHNNHEFHQRNDTQLPQLFTDKVQALGCATMHYMLHPSESLFWGASNPAISKECYTSFFRRYEKALSEYTDLLEHMQWLLKDQGEKTSPENIKNLLDQLNIRDVRLCPPIPKIHQRSPNLTQNANQKNNTKHVLVSGFSCSQISWAFYIAGLAIASLISCGLGSIVTMILQKKKSDPVDEVDEEASLSDASDPIDEVDEEASLSDASEEETSLNGSSEQSPSENQKSRYKGKCYPVINPGVHRTQRLGYHP